MMSTLSRSRNLHINYYLRLIVFSRRSSRADSAPAVGILSVHAKATADLQRIR